MMLMYYFLYLVVSKTFARVLQVQVSLLYVLAREREGGGRDMVDESRTGDTHL